MFYTPGKRFEKKLLLCALLGVSLAMCINLVFSMIRMDRLFPVYTTSVRPWLFRFSLPVGIVLYGVVTPFIEEMIFRFFFFRKLCVYVIAQAAGIASAVIFGIYHGNAVQFIYAFIFGLVLAYVYWRFEKILSAILVHSAANIYVYVTYFLPLGGIFEELRIKMTVILLSGLVSVLIMRYFLNTAPEKSTLPEKPFFPKRY